jgi:hypothetical protein
MHLWYSLNDQMVTLVSNIFTTAGSYVVYMYIHENGKHLECGAERLGSLQAVVQADVKGEYTVWMCSNTVCIVRVCLQ